MVTDCGRGEILKIIMLEKVPLLLMQVLSCVCDWGGEENKTVESKNTKLRSYCWMNHLYGHWEKCKWIGRVVEERYKDRDNKQDRY